MHRILLVLLAAVLTACASATPTVTPQPRLAADIIAPLSEIAAREADDPALTVDSTGAPLVAWIDGNLLRVARWDGASWAGLGEGPLNIDAEAGTRLIRRWRAAPMVR